jgi:hypothetical protein
MSYQFGDICHQLNDTNLLIFMWKTIDFE